MGRLALFCSREQLFPPSVGGGGRETSIRGEGEAVNPAPRPGVRTISLLVECFSLTSNQLTNGTCPNTPSVCFLAASHLFICYFNFLSALCVRAYVHAPIPVK